MIFKFSRLLMLILITTLMVSPAFAQWSDTSRSSLSILTSGDRGSQANAITGILHVDAVNNLDAFTAVYASRVSAGGETLSENLLARVEGGWGNDAVGIYGYAAAESNKEKATRSVRWGYYGRWFATENISVGAGNWAKNQADIEDVLGDGAGAGASDGVSFGWELNINLELENFRTQLKLLPELTGKYVEAQLRPSYSASLGTIGGGEGIEVAWTINGLVDYISDASVRGVEPLQWSYTAGINFLF